MNGNRSLDDHVQIDLKIAPTILYLSLHYNFKNDQHVGVNGSNVDDSLRAGTNECQTHPGATLERFETAGNQQEPLTLARMHITESDSMFHIDHEFYMSNIEQIPSDAECRKFCPHENKNSISS